MADQQYIVSTGVIVPDTSAILATVIAEFQTALGADIITTPDTPEGVLIAAEVSARTAVLRNNAALANQINPNESGGVFLDAIWALTGGERDAATKSTAICTITGAVGTIVNTSTQFRSTAGNLWQVSTAVTIPTGGTTSVEVIATEYGQISAGTGSITQIVVGVIGLETVTNPAPATIGTLTQSDLSVKSLRKKTLGLNSSGLPTAVIAAVYSVENVRSLTFRENVTAVTATIDGVSLVAHSIYLCVDGGTDLDVATAILSRKGVGCNYNGSISVPVLEPASGQLYNVQFDRPSIVPLLIRVTARANNPLINPQTSIREAILAYANGGLVDESGFVVGASASPFEIAGAINVREPSIYVQKVELALASDSVFSVAEIPIAVFEKASITESSISVIPL